MMVSSVRKIAPGNQTIKVNIAGLFEAAAYQETIFIKCIFIKAKKTKQQ